MKNIRYFVKFSRLTAHLLHGFFVCLFLFPWLNREAQKHRIQHWSKKLLALFNIRISPNTASTLSSSILISNHISWLDIFVINSIAPCRFVAKSDIRSWPFLGWLCERGGTIFLTRGKKADVKRIYQYLIEQIEVGEQVAFFPEGTTSLQGDVLPFHANLFEAAIHAKVPVQPVALRYLNREGDFHQAVEYVGDTTFVTSMFKVLGSNEIIVELHGLEFIPSDGAHRRELASASRDAVIAALKNNENIHV